MDWRESSGEEAWISSFRLRERCREESEEPEIERETMVLSRCKEQGSGTSILWVSLDSRDLSLNFIVTIACEWILILIQWS